MRKDIQKGIKKAQKRKILYLSGGSLALIVVAIAVIFMFYTNFVENDESSKISDVNGLSEASKEIADTKQTSIEIGKSVNEAKNEITVNENKNETNNNVIVVPKVQEDNNKSVQSKPEEIKETVEKNKQEVTAKKEETKPQEPVFAMPVEGEILKEYAKDKLVYSDTLKEWVTHSGIDIRAEKTSIVKASEAGIVKSIKNDPRYGLTVVIEHSSRL